MGESDPSIKIAKFVLPILVYIPITVVTAIFLLFFRNKIFKNYSNTRRSRKFI